MTHICFSFYVSIEQHVHVQGLYYTFKSILFALQMVIPNTASARGEIISAPMSMIVGMTIMSAAGVQYVPNIPLYHS